MMKPRARPQRSSDAARLTHGVFDIVVFLKGLNGLLELVGGSALLLAPGDAIDRLVHHLTAQELAADPGDPIANTLIHWAQGFGHDAQTLAIAYLLFHGIVKTSLAVLLLMGKTWAYPTAVTFFTFFVAYLLFRLTRNWSWPVSGLVAFDLLTIAVILLDWRAKRRLAA
ncbi:MAG TPA: DUF2127 domain-containing protein [Dongiaceae bacterium]|nr:DUF2127 domain-containing protein [Dongiaceae bacterium]